jgi:lysophospholipase L1-like esterase
MKWKSAICASISLSVLAFSPLAPAADPAPSRENIEWCDIWIAQANDTKLPRVLLIGDSITRGYYPEVAKRLEGKANIARLATSAFLSDPMLLQEIALVLDNVKFDVVHFNNGMHGWQHNEEEYRKFFPAFLETIQKHAPQAKLIWAATTPLKESAPVKPGEMRSSDERIAARNAIALELVKPLDIPVDDLFTPAKGHPEYHSDNVHFNPKGIAVQADQVATEIAKLLPH